MNIPKERGLTRLRRGLTVFAGLLLLWWLAAQSGIPAFLLPTPGAVAQALWDGRGYLAWHTLVTASEIVSGLALGVLLGAALALCMIFSPRLQRWLMPLVLTSQAIPVFALAPLLVLWFGFGMSAKVAMAVLVIFFPVVSAFSTGCAGSTTTISIWRARCALRAGAAAARAADGGAAGLRLRPAHGRRRRADRRHHRRMGRLGRRAGLRDAERQRAHADRRLLRRAVYFGADDRAAVGCGGCATAAPDRLGAGKRLIYPSYFKLQVCWLPLLTRITYLSKLIGTRSVAAFLQLELFRV